MLHVKLYKSHGNWGVCDRARTVIIKYMGIVDRLLLTQTLIVLLNLVVCVCVSYVEYNSG